MITKGQAIELLNVSIPYPDQMKNFDFDKDGVIYFEWRRNRYRLELQFCRIEKSEGCILIGDDCSMLMTHLLKSKLSRFE